MNPVRFPFALRSGKGSGLYLWGFLIPIAMMLLTYGLIGIFPFGNETLLVKDMNGQYVSFFSYLQSIFNGENNLLYTFSKTLGGDMVGLEAYYLMSPLNLLFWFFPTDRLTEAIEIVTLLKVGLCGLSFTLYLRQQYPYSFSSRYPAPTAILIFSTSYALMAYNLIYQQNLMWLDGVILLPLILLGIDRIIRLRRFLLYLLTLSCALITNYYIGYMICIFSLFYFAYKLYLYRAGQDRGLRPKGERRAGIFILSSLLAGGLAAFLLIPTFMSLSGGKAELSLANLAFRWNFNPFIIINQLFTGVFEWEEISNGLPNVFPGILITFLAILYFFNQAIAWKEKLASSALLFLMMISFSVNTLDRVWHGFNPPVSFPYRYAFLFSFILISLAHKCFVNLKAGIRGGQILAGAALLLILLWLSTERAVSGTVVYSDGLLIVILSGLLYAYSTDSRISSPYAVIMVILACGNLGLNAYQTLKVMPYTEREQFIQYVHEVGPVIEAVKAQDQGFYRLEKTFQYSHNDAMLFSYAGLSHFSSGEKTDVKEFMGEMGFRNNWHWAYYNKGSTLTMDSFLGVKYLLSKDQPNAYYPLLFRRGEIGVYQNPYALPLGFMVNNGIERADITSPNLFEVQNNMYKAMTVADSTSIFKKARIEKINLINAYLYRSDPIYEYVQTDRTKKSYIEYRIRVEREEPLYAYFPTTTMYQVNIFLNDQPLGVYFDPYRYDIVALGTFKKNDIITFKMKLNEDEVAFNDALFYYQDMNVFTQTYNSLTQNPYQIMKYGGFYLKGEVTATKDKNLLLLTFPYEKDWQVWLDGKRVDAKKVLNTLMALEIPLGTHQIELKYVPAGLKMGGGITLFSAVALGIWLYFKYKNKALSKAISR